MRCVQPECGTWSLLRYSLGMATSMSPSCLSVFKPVKSLSSFFGIWFASPSTRWTRIVNKNLLHLTLSPPPPFFFSPGNECNQEAVRSLFILDREWDQDIRRSTSPLNTGRTPSMPFPLFPRHGGFMRLSQCALPRRHFGEQIANDGEIRERKRE